MQRCFFDFADSGELVPDEMGTVLKGVEAARREATKALWEIAGDTLSESDRREIEIKVRDEADRPILPATLKFEMRTRVG